MKKPRMTPQERDASMDRLLRKAMAADVRSAPGECLDVETVAAWSDGTLSKAEQAAAEAHASHCARCQAMLAAMVRTEPAVGAPSRSRFFRWAITLGPALAAAAAVVLWFAVDRQNSPADLHERPAAVAEAESKVADAKAIPGPGRAAPAEVDAFRADKDEAGKKELSKRLELRDRRERAGAAGEAVKVAPLDGAQGKPKAPDRERELTAGALAAPPASTTPAAPPSPTAAPVTVTSAAQEPVVSPVQTLDQVQAKQRQNPPSPLQQAGQTQTQSVSGYTQNEQKPREQSGDRALFARADASALQVPSPIPAVRWRVTDGRTVQISTDGGNVWNTQHAVDGPSLILAGAAPSSSVCWLIGQGGLVLVTKDGRTWQRVAFPESADLRTLTASDASNASVVTADGRTFTTADGGRSWKQ